MNEWLVVEQLWVWMHGASTHLGFLTKALPSLCVARRRKHKGRKGPARDVALLRVVLAKMEAGAATSTRTHTKQTAKTSVRSGRGPATCRDTAQNSLVFLSTSLMQRLIRRSLFPCLTSSHLQTIHCRLPEDISSIVRLRSKWKIEILHLSTAHFSLRTLATNTPRKARCSKDRLIRRKDVDGN